MNDVTKGLLLASTGLMYFASTPAIAQQQPAAKSDEVAEIIVTAQKREQKLSNVGMAITAVAGPELTQRGITSPETLVKIEPSLQYAKSNNGLPVYSVRGVGYYDQSLAAAPAVSLYIDEQPYAYPTLSKGAVLDLERVEVLKGPQGILYGQNATGGAINFIAAKPTERLAFGADATYARFNAVSLGGFVSGPLGDTLKARLSFRIDEGGAWQRSNTRDDELGDKNFKTARLLLEWTPDPALTVNLNVNGFLDNSETQAGQLAGFRFGNPNYISDHPAAYFTTPQAYLPNAADFPFYPAIIQAQVSNPISPRKPRAADWVAGTHPKNNEDYLAGNLRLDYNLSDDITISSLTKYEYFRQDNFIDLGGVNVLEIQAMIDAKVDSFGQELRLQGKTSDQRLQWLIGLNYASDKSNEINFSPDRASGTFLTGGAIKSVIPVAPFQSFAVFHDNDTKTKSVFANLEYQITDTLSAHGGLRYTESKVVSASCSTIESPVLLAFLTGVSTLITGKPQPTLAPGSCATFIPDGSLNLYRTTLKEHNIPWRAGVDWKVTPDSLLYLSVSKGFKAGGTPALGAASYVQLLPITQESVLAYEGGVKTFLFDRTLQITGAVFHYDYKNKQLLGRILDPNGIFGALQALVNIPKSREDGAEISANWRVTRGLTLNGAATYLDTKVTSDFFNYNPYILTPSDTINFKGQRFPFTPKWALSYGARYDWAFSSKASAYVGFNGLYQSSTVSVFGARQAAARGPAFDIKGYGVLDLTAGIETGGWQFQLFAKNVTNKYYVTNIFYQFDNTLRYAGAPATYGIGVHYRF